MISGLAEHGVDVVAIAGQRGVTAQQLMELLPLALVDEILACCFASCADPGLGLKLGAQIRPELFGVVGFAAMSCARLGEALERICRYKRALAGDRLTLRRSGEAAVLRVELTTSAGVYARSKLDGEFAFLVGFARRMTGAPVLPLRVTYATPAPADMREHAALFGCAPEFMADHNELWLPATELLRPLVGADPTLAALFVIQAEQLLRLAQGDSLTDRVRGALAELLRGEAPGVAAVARRLGLSERSLQRRLREEGTSFAALVDATRQELATHYLCDADLPAAEVAFLLGFAGAPSFYRAFRRWTQTTPEAYRAGRRGEAQVAVPRGRSVTVTLGA
ncbi:MAG TPA: AraC family transcriptional regulator [Nannocystis sp.]